MLQVTPIKEGFNRLRGNVEKVVINYFAATYYIAKTSSSLASFSKCLEFMHFGECPTLGQEMYSNEVVCQRFINYKKCDRMK